MRPLRSDQRVLRTRDRERDDEQRDESSDPDADELPLVGAAEAAVALDLDQERGDRRAAGEAAEVAADRDPRNRERDCEVEQDDGPDAALHDADTARAG